MQGAFRESHYWLSVTEKLDDKNIYHGVYDYLFNELPVTFDCLVFMRFSLKLIHNLDTNTTHSAA